MNQTRNLITNIIFNIIVTLGLIYGLIHLPSGDSPLPWYANMLINVLMLILFNIILLYIDKSITSPDNIPVIAPAGFGLMLYLLLQYCLGNFKKVRTVNGSYFIRYNRHDKQIYIYDFSILKYARVDEMGFEGSPNDIKRLKEKINDIISTKGFSFSKWDGALDDESKRMGTINQIIK